MEIRFSTASLTDYDGDALVIGCFEGARPSGPAAQVDDALDGLIGSLIESGEIRGKQSEITVIHTRGALPCGRVAVVGLGGAGSTPLLAARHASGAAARHLQARGCRRIALALHAGMPAGVRAEHSVRATVEGAYAGIYRGEECKSRRDLPGELLETTIVGLPSDEDDDAVVASGRAGRISGEAANYARRLVNLPPNEITPSRLAREAAEIAAAGGLEVEILEPEQIAELGMGALCAVARGSEEPARLIVLRWRGGADGPRLALVGKGLTFDSGGLSLKAADRMTMMKQDMAGGAAVLAAMRAIAEMQLRLDVTGIVPATENLPSGRAYKPDDVVKAFDGKKIEIVSTDAEGRLILADALAYAHHLGATHIVDVATLTGACVIALGHAASGVMGNDPALIDAVIDAGERAGERMWQLPLFREYRSQLDSKVADIKNVGGRPAGTITAGWFLREFVGETAWAHIDIAGTAWSEKDEPHRIEGGTGAGTRTLIALAERMAGGEV